jgi:NADH-ubiquinone oxidoreductase chain 5
MAIPLMVLAIGSIFWGFFSRDMFLGLGSPFFMNTITTSFEHLVAIDAEFASASLKNIPFFLTILGAVLSFLLINCSITSKEVIFSYKMSKFYRKLYNFLSKKWHFDQLSSEVVVHRLMNFGYRVSFQLLDKGNIEVFGAFGSSIKLLSFSQSLSSYQSGFLFHYSFIMISAVLAFLTLLITLSLNMGLNLLMISLFFSYVIFSIN